ncbi:PhnD/SsuA/transferrin family substrate-binding protein [Oxynema aestuarii]|jgi:phosphonate transport system substrate-binding protein|uniref:PhnD/SsuA/transferrin family substrate-binding protein n=1 Tax=Oxynema aestuarii AP17 TaxID=2064643 RepID=A0A6H1TYP7_9CYAN|nr:PhnD/SsuA/transferrin family substrate-binding protein [Oxynema aestuarii]QIZ71701.1 PhnD/SsuA/transferrin family substrate-binding protein [Oxynema aestuarii AP17]RMH78158.1 MAG: phosphonate ABC transporter substrate-binding protein [Cyanobacteria bacterium J007]
MMKRRHAIAYIGLFFLWLTGCTLFKRRSPPPSNPATLHELDRLRFAVTDVQGEEQLKRDYEQFRQVLEEVLEKKIDFVPVQHYTDAAIALQLNKVDLVLAGPSEYFLISTRSRELPILSITRPNYYSAIAVAAVSGIESLSDLKGKTIAMVKVGSTSGHLGTTKLLLDAGLNPKSDCKIVMLGREGSLEALKNGEVDAWGGSLTDYETFFNSEGFSETDFPIIARGELLPDDIFLVNQQLGEELARDIKTRMFDAQNKLLTAIAATEGNQKYRNSRFVNFDASQYEAIVNLYHNLGYTDSLP